MQIKNLSAAQVQPFGEILSAESELLPPCAERWQIRPGADVRELRADGPVVLDYVSGMPLLVIYEKDARSVYYLDRVLALRPGVRFSIAALGSGCEVDCRARQPGLVQLLACHPAEEFSGTGSELNLERLYTFFYQECASDFYFRGEQHEAFELVYVDRGELHNLAGGADVLLRQQQLMLIGRNVWHMQYADRPVSFLTVSFRAAELPCSRLTGRALSLTARQIGLVRQMLEAHGAESYAYDCVESLLKLLLADLLRGLDRQPSADAAQPLPATSHTERRIGPGKSSACRRLPTRRTSARHICTACSALSSVSRRGRISQRSGSRKASSCCAAERCPWARSQKSSAFPASSTFPVSSAPSRA